MPPESSATGLVTMREISPASTSTTASASRKMNTMRSRTEISESTVSCTSVSSTSTPSLCPSSSSGAAKQPTQCAKRRARSARRARKGPASCLRHPADGSHNPRPFPAQNGMHLAQRQQRAAPLAERVVRHLAIRIYNQKGGRRPGWPPVQAADETHPRCRRSSFPPAQRQGSGSAWHGCGSRRKTARRRLSAPSKTRPDKTTRR